MPEANALTLLEAFNWIEQEQLRGPRVFISDLMFWRTLQGLQTETNWRLLQLASEINQAINIIPNLLIDYIPWDWNKFAAFIIVWKNPSTGSSFFFSSRTGKKPNWLMPEFCIKISLLRL